MKKSAKIVNDIQGVRGAIVVELIDATYADPYWLARFGERGRLLAEQDAQYHIDNLERAIRFNLLSAPTHHYRWVQNVLLHRGFCTYHLQQFLDLLSAQLQERLPQHFPSIQPYLLAGYQGLSYTSPACVALVEHQAAISSRAIESVLERYTPRPDRLAAWVQSRQQEMTLHLSYLADAVERQTPTLFEQHLHWMQRFLPSQGVSEGILFAELDQTGRQITLLLPADLANLFTALLDPLLTGWDPPGR